jgi:stage V sporulation protein D (sporulation-specific penicillin-binding protein)
LPKQKVASSTIRKRLLACFVGFLLISLALIFRLAWIQLVKAEEYRQLAHQQQYRSLKVLPPRGTIFDRRLRVLAISASAETIVANPPQITDREGTARQLAEVLGLDYERVLGQVSAKQAAVYIKRQVEEEEALQVRQLGLKGIRFLPESKRYYPNERLLSQVLGFVGVDQGWSGLEIRYEETLRGREGRYTFLSDGRGLPIPQGITRYVEAQKGRDLILTVDEYLQFILDREMDRAMAEFEPQRIFSLAVNPKTGEILAMAGKPDFDPNHYARFSQEYWQISPISSTFEPGSTFKLVTLSAAIDRGVYNSREGFFCSGAVRVGGHSIGCWTRSRGGHGSINFMQVVLSSCNPGFITLGNRLGGDTLLDYINAFGFGARSGIDLPGESTGIIFRPDQFGPVELATTSFGQGISVTPLQQVMAVSAMINGGYLMQPYIVSEIRDPDGTVIEKREPTVVRQVISTETSKEVKHIMEMVVVDGSGKNAAVPGYRFGGKTGTAQKVGPGGRYISGQFIVSFLGFFPMEDPEVLLYIAVDSARRGIQYGSQIPAPLFKRVATDYLSYLGIPPDKPGEQQAPPALVKVPDLTGRTREEAALEVDPLGLVVTPVGPGGTIRQQTPKAGALVPLQTEILAYMDREGAGQVQVPNLAGRTMREAAEILSWLGLHMKSFGSGVVKTQDPRAWESVLPGSEIVLEFGTGD